MTTRFTGLVPALALLAVGTAHAQVTNQTGSMAYPQSLPSGQVQIQAPTTRDTGNMAYPASPGGVTETAPKGADTGNMASPMGRSGLRGRAMPIAARRAPAGDPANSMRPDVAPTPAQSATARSLDEAPSAAPVPYTDFLPPEKPMRGKAMAGKRMMARHPIHHAVMKHAAMPAKAAPAPAAAAAPAPSATPAPATAK